ncbi:TAXI family TRAP transporter solute-binding subunit [Actinocatenispora rupis]|uniref:C4-dicarboxylate ABC transporter substrate-binding protein n=1 Tax=Actinocatenispora rupis TaxID=519421 RepID=A0A8J3JAC8_9ACTN|nr:TAXI family TRAP transporter solute-binding subunit [Actinocatenispora rupis]GID14732.1 C4-dicarboxylate ABC transporter substrate-binding protein [Actinocatenispora rupis]
MKRRRLLGGLVAAGAAALLPGCTEEEVPRPPLPLSAGEDGGVYWPLGRALSVTLRTRWRSDPLVTSGSADNQERLRDGRARLAFSTVDVADEAQSGRGPFDAKYPLRALAGLYSDYVHLVVRAESQMKDLDGLAGRPVSTGAPGSGTEIVATRMLAAAGITLRGFERHRLDLHDSIAALRAGVVDAFFFSGGLPTPAIAKFVTDGDSPVRLLDLGQYLDTMRSQYGEVYASGWIPTNAYGLSSVTTVSIPNILAVPHTIGAESAYQLTRLLFVAKPRLARAHPEGRQLDPRSAIDTYPVPLHPGAERYYREQKRA